MLKFSKAKAAVAAAAMGFMSLSPAASQADENFILAHAMNTDHVFHSLSERFLGEVEGSGLNVAYHPGGDLGDWTSLFEQSMQGVVPMTLTWGASEFDARLDLAYLGYVVSNWEEARALYGPGSAMLGVYNSILHDLGVHAVGIIPTDFGSVVIRKGVGAMPVNLPEDGNGLKIRVPGLPVAVDRFNNFGFSAVPIPLAEVYTALQLGTVDARSFSTAVETYQLRDVLETNILTNDYFETAFWLVNKDWWEGLDAADREKLQGAIDSTIEFSWGEAEAKSNEFLQKARDEGINVVELTDAQLQALKDITYEKEWPAMEETLGSEVMNQVRAAIGLK
ncbi:TRAP transporter substrate-binding protein DctP [Leisingera sp. ANG-M1]|uniref:TRAP transporter substrate-binding protein DctP n=1 Tax=Leisingera sp. ANG-M1 TaxID=1577895 RepID=UPI000B1757B3|nr:TRAP transporter substrate-binding protein DctP [Leisingera sp. ANG-M1]